MFAWTERDSGATGTYCIASPLACGVGLWSLHLGTISNAVYTETTSYNTVAPGLGGWFELGNFGGTRSATVANTTDNGFLTFVSNSGTSGQPHYCPDMFAVHWSIIRSAA